MWPTFERQDECFSMQIGLARSTPYTMTLSTLSLSLTLQMVREQSSLAPKLTARGRASRAGAQLSGLASLTKQELSACGYLSMASIGPISPSRFILGAACSWHDCSRWLSRANSHCWLGRPN